MTERSLRSILRVTKRRSARPTKNMARLCYCIADNILHSRPDSEELRQRYISCRMGSDPARPAGVFFCFSLPHRAQSIPEALSSEQGKAPRHGDGDLFFRIGRRLGGYFSGCAATAGSERTCRGDQPLLAGDLAGKEVHFFTSLLVFRSDRFDREALVPAEPGGSA